MSRAGQYIEDTNLSQAWASAYLAVVQADEIQPLIVSVAGHNDGLPAEDPAIHSALNEILGKHGMPSVETVAGTIFPKSLWNPKRPRGELYDRYNRILPRVLHYRRNQHGTYFQRLIAFGPNGINQLEHVLGTWERGNHRRSALVASIIDPSSDHTHQRQRGFPCLQQVSFVPKTGRGLAIVGFYAMQYMLERAYGNYLGLVRLGNFMAQEMGLELTQMTCVAAIAKRDPGIAKRHHSRFARSLQRLIDAAAEEQPA